MNNRFVRILLADDNDADVFLVRRALDLHVGEYELLLARDGEEALKILERAEGDRSAPCPDFAVLDINLPRCSGIEVLERIRHTVRCASAPVIIFTSSDSPQDKAAALQLGANRYFQKPADLDGFMQLGKLVKEILPQRAS